MGDRVFELAVPVAVFEEVFGGQEVVLLAGDVDGLVLPDGAWLEEAGVAELAGGFGVDAEISFELVGGVEELVVAGGLTGDEAGVDGGLAVRTFEAMFIVPAAAGGAVAEPAGEAFFFEAVTIGFAVEAGFTFDFAERIFNNDLGDKAQEAHAFNGGFGHGFAGLGQFFVADEVGVSQPFFGCAFFGFFFGWALL